MDKRYKYVRDGGNTVIAISTYAGKTVKGIAKCDPNDNFSYDYENGIYLRTKIIFGYTSLSSDYEYKFSYTINHKFYCNYQ